MKNITLKFSILVTVILALTFLKANAQITITGNDMPAPYDHVRVSTGLNLGFINYSETGENFTWDFSQLIPISQSVDSFISITDVPIFILLYFGNASNLVKKDNNTIPIPGFPITKQFSFLKNTSNSFNDAGVLYTIAGIPIPLKYNSPDILYNFPMNYGNTGSSYAEYALGVPSVGYISKKINRTNTVDGWGTLTTPYGTFEVLRQKSEVSQFDSLYIDSLGIGLPMYQEYTEYTWVGIGQKLPLLKITSSLGGVIATYIDSLRFPSAINYNAEIITNNVTIFPNPTKDIVNITFNLLSKSNVIFEIYTISGAKVAFDKIDNQMIGTISHSINVKQLGIKKGEYILQISAGNNSVSKKLIIE